MHAEFLHTVMHDVTKSFHHLPCKKTANLYTPLSTQFCDSLLGYIQPKKHKF